MSYHAGSQQIPILCKNCGGAAQPGLDGSVVCPYCGEKDSLPADELGRALELKRRLTAAARSVVQMRGLEGALGHIFESRGAFLRASGLWLALVPIFLGYALFMNWEILARTPPAFVPTLLVSMSMGPMLVGGVGLAVCVALAVGRRSYRKQVRRHLFARAPRQEGLPARCRACGADLPDQRDPFIVCEYCETSNLVTPELQKDREALLAAEESFYRQRSNQAVAATRVGSIHMSRTVTVAVVLVYLGMFALGYLAQALLPKA